MSRAPCVVGECTELNRVATPGREGLRTRLHTFASLPSSRLVDVALCYRTYPPGVVMVSLSLSTRGPEINNAAWRKYGAHN